MDFDYVIGFLIGVLIFLVALVTISNSNEIKEIKENTGYTIYQNCDEVNGRWYCYDN